MARYFDFGYLPTGVTHFDYAQAKTMGFVGVCRYLSLSPGKNITATEAATIRSLGLDLVCVWETTATRSTEGSAAGKNDGAMAARMARTIGYPQGATLYAATDSDATWTTVSAYQGSFNAVVAQWGYRGDIYAGYRVVAGAVQAGFSVEPWQTAAWSKDAKGNMQVHPMAVLFQDNFHVPISGVDCDSSQVRGKINAWAANQPNSYDPPPQTPGADMERVLYVPNDPKRTKRLYLGGGRVGAPMSAAAAQAYAEIGIVLDPVSVDTYDIFVNQSS